MFIRNLAVTNFMIHRQTELVLQPLTGLVGPNNSGKSALFDAILNFSNVAKDSVGAVFPPGPYSYRSRHHNGGTTDSPIGYTVDLSRSSTTDEFLRYRVAYRQTDWNAGTASYEITEERLTSFPDQTVLFDRNSGTNAYPDLASALDDDTSFVAAARRAVIQGRLPRGTLLADIARSIGIIGKYRLEPAVLSKPAATPDVLSPAGKELNPPRMRYTGEGLAGVLYFLATTRHPTLDQIVSRVADSIDGFAGFSFNAVGSDSVGFSALFSDSRGAVEAPNLSAGTLSLIGWITLLSQSGRQPIMMLEEPELGLTPRSTGAVYRAAADAVRGGDQSTQILITSHSPSVVTWIAEDFGQDAVYVLRPSEGACSPETYARSLDDKHDPPRLARAMAVDLANQVMHGF